MTTTVLEPDSDLDSARAIPIVALGWAALTAWAGWQSHHSDWRPTWLYPPLMVVAALLLLVFLSVVGVRQRRALRHATASLDRPFLVRAIAEFGAQRRGQSYRVREQLPLQMPTPRRSRVIDRLGHDSTVVPSPGAVSRVALRSAG